MNISIKNHNDHYGTEIKNFTILGTNDFWKTRYQAFERRHMFMDVNILHDYSDQIYLKICDKIQYEYYGRKGYFPKRVLIWTI